MQRAIILALLCFLAYGCESETASNPTESISLTVTGLSPSRPNEIYALWLDFPTSSVRAKHDPQHGTSAYKLVSTFDVSTSGEITGLDRNDLRAKLGQPLALAQHGLISIERKDSIGPAPYIPFLVGEITGTASKGNATLTMDHSEATGYTFETLTAGATLASPATSPEDFSGELYLMRATSAGSAEASISGLVPLPTKWRYGLWAIDSATRSLPPFNIFYGYFTDVAQPDSNPDDNRFPFPGGRYPAATNEPVYALNSGNVTIMVTLEPNFAYARPPVPFGAIVLKTVVPKDRHAFDPFPLENRSLNLPQASLLLDR